MVFEIIHKPTFTNQLLAIPGEYVAQVLEKIELLRDDPSPHGKAKKKLHGYKAVSIASDRATIASSTPMAIAGFLGSRYPYVPNGSTPQAKEEILRRERRTLFVGMTRAMRALLVVVPAKKPGALLESFDETLWNLGSTAA